MGTCRLNWAPLALVAKISLQIAGRGPSLYRGVALSREQLYGGFAGLFNLGTLPKHIPKAGDVAVAVSWGGEGCKSSCRTLSAAFTSLCCTRKTFKGQRDMALLSPLFL